MKKCIALTLVILLVLSLGACKPEVETNVSEPNQTQEETITIGENDSQTTDETDKEGEKAEEKKPAEIPDKTPEKQPEKQPAQKPVTKPEEKPSETPVVSTLGKTLLADFKSKAGMDTLSLANALLENPAIQFMGGAMEVEEGLLSGFDNAEITGFTSGAVFMPMIGSIAFIGYVFEVENASDVPGFIAKLEQNANRRWNVCVEAEEMVTGSVGNKVFFVMCPTSLEG